MCGDKGRNVGASIRIGFGYDSHRFLTADEIRGAREGKIETGTDYIDPDKPLILGGVRVDGDFPPFKARSDGDVVFHAAVNAILSALAIDEVRDIGTLFPNTDPANSNRSSSDFLAKASELVCERGLQISNLKLTVKGRPRVDLAGVRSNLAEILGIDRDRVLVQGTSGEEMDAAGLGLGVEVFGICSLC